MAEIARRDERVEQRLRLLAARGLVRSLANAEIQRLESPFDCGPHDFLQQQSARPATGDVGLARVGEDKAAQANSSGEDPEDGDRAIAKHESVQLHRSGSCGDAVTGQPAKEGLRRGAFISVGWPAVRRPLALLFEKGGQDLRRLRFVLRRDIGDRAHRRQLAGRPAQVLLRRLREMGLAPGRKRQWELRFIGETRARAPAERGQGIPRALPLAGLVEEREPIDASRSGARRRRHERCEFAGAPDAAGPKEAEVEIRLLAAEEGRERQRPPPAPGERQQRRRLTGSVFRDHDERLEA